MQDTKVRIEKILPRLIEAGLKGNSRDMELLTLSVIRILKNENSALASELSTLIGKSRGHSASVRRSNPIPIPSDADAGLSLVQVTNPQGAEEPILDKNIKETINRFLLERAKSDILIENGMLPPASILLKGPPGTGKTMLANWLASELHLNLVTLDLATSVSSFLGKTGQNLRRSLDYAKSYPCLLLLDEFDAIGKRRDDPSEIGELKRIVNVLLKELENWPMHSILVAATNHPELLDPAINRRFDTVISLPLPGLEERTIIIARSCEHFSKYISSDLIQLLASLYEGLNGSDIETRIRSIVRKHLLDNTTLEKALTESIITEYQNSRLKVQKDSVGELSIILQRQGKTVREIASMTGYTPGNIQHHLNKEKKKWQTKED